MPSIYYIAPPDPRWTPEEQAQYVPGEGTIAVRRRCTRCGPATSCSSCTSNRNPSQIAQLFQSYAFTEGWAHYAEEMMSGQGLRTGSPEWRIGQLLQAL